MEITYELWGDVRIVGLVGRLDSGAVAAIEAAFAPRLGDMPPRLAIDMTRLDYISSAGLRALLVVAKKVQQFRGKVALFGLTPGVSEVFSVSGFDTIFSIHPDRASAVESVR